MCRQEPECATDFPLVPPTDSGSHLERRRCSDGFHDHESHSRDLTHSRSSRGSAESALNRRCRGQVQSGTSSAPLPCPDRGDSTPAVRYPYRAYRHSYRIDASCEH